MASEISENFGLFADSEEPILKIKTVEGFPKYLISNTGELINKKTGRHTRGALSGKYWKFSLTNEGTRTCAYVHALLARAFLPNPENKPFVDHIDGNRNNNKLSNLRWATIAENNQNQRVRVKEGKSSRFKGVYFRKATGKWVARIRHNCKLIHLGLFDSEEEAALKYNEKARELFGVFACLNIVK